ncbi:calcium-binding protein [Gordonia sp. YC-JH1]|nr:calcium-binding protein [Gordonia sp. YC-JH1]
MNTQHAAAPVSSAANAIMPNVVCMNLQEAQNEIQRAGVFYSRSNDATGRGRHQIRDRNWVVVAQTPSPGTPIGEGDAVLSVVKIGEPSLC